MKRAEYLNDLRVLDGQELDERLKAVRGELFNLRFQAATGQLENHRQIRHVRRQIAQVLTVMQSRRLGMEVQVSATEAAIGVTAPRTRRNRAAAEVPTPVEQGAAGAEEDQA